jgi:hypothetical protein
MTPLKRFPREKLTPLKLPEFFLQNFSYEITKLRNSSKNSCELSAGSLTTPKLSGVTYHAETISAG